MAKKKPKKETKEAVYDREVAPLMAKVIEVCQANKIAMFASFSTPNEEDPALHCTTALLEKDHEPSPELVASYNALFHRPGAMMISLRDKDGKIIQSTAVI